MRSFVTLALLVASATALSTRSTMEELDFDAWLKFWKKKRTSAEYNMRKTLFEEHKRKVMMHNAEYRAGKQTWWMALNELADSTPEEFAVLRSHKYAPSNAPVVTYTNTTGNPDSVDWRTKGAVSKVKNQGGCGSCWAFSATESVESMYQIASGKLLELAPQTYVDCVKNPNECGGTGGCEGATMELAFNLTVTKGIALESALPYKARDHACPDYKPAVKASGYVKNPVNDAASLETALATKGPQSVTVAAGNWQFYGGGIFTGCSSGMKDNTLDHGVQAVGYTQKYWIVRNSWGPGWGDHGYIHLSREFDDKTYVDKRPGDGVACKPAPKSQIVGGECGVLFDTSYPTGVTAA